MRGIATLLGLLGLAVGGALPAAAVPISVQFAGVLTDVDASGTGADPRFGQIMEGDGFVGSFTYDTEAPEVAFGTYLCPVPPTLAATACGINLSIEDRVDFSTDPDEDFRFTPGTSTVLTPSLFFFQGALDSDLTDSQGDAPVLAVRLIDSSNTMPLSEIPMFLDFDDFDVLELRFVNRADGSVVSGMPFVSGRIESLVTMPEPSTAALVSLGLLGLAAGRRRRR